MQCTRQNVRVLTHTVHEQPDALFAGAQYSCLHDGECPFEEPQTATLIIGGPQVEHWQGDAFTRAVGQARDRLVEAHHKTAVPSSHTAKVRERSARMETPHAQTTTTETGPNATAQTGNPVTRPE
jgi:hypothetical protein